MSTRNAGHRGSARGGKRAAFRAWRHSRPFWGGLLLLLAGVELLAIPLSGVLIKGQVKLVIYIGIGGVFGVLIGALLIAAGIVLWVNPTQRVFYGIAGVVLGILSFPASNLGGFFIGMLLAIIGGALAFAWTPAEPRDDGPHGGGRFAPPDSAGPMDTDTRVDLPALMDDEPRPRRPRYGGSGPAANSGPGYRFMAATAMPAVVLVGLVGSSGAATTSSTCVLGLFCSSSSPSPSASSNSGSGSASSPSPSPSPSSSGSGVGGLLPSSSGSGGAVGKVIKSAAGKAAGAAGKAAGTAGKAAGKKPAAGKGGPVNQVTAPAGLVAPSATSVLTAKSSSMTKFNFVGVATLPVGGGGSEKALAFTAGSASLSGVGIKVIQSGKTVDTTTSSVGFPSGMTLYTTKLCGQVEGVAPNICFTPDTASQIALKLASVIGSAGPISMTNVTADQFISIGPVNQWGALNMATVG